MQLFEKHGTLIERNTALIEKVSPCIKGTSCSATRTSGSSSRTHMSSSKRSRGTMCRRLRERRQQARPKSHRRKPHGQHRSLHQRRNRPPAQILALHHPPQSCRHPHQTRERQNLGVYLPVVPREVKRSIDTRHASENNRTVLFKIHMSKIDPMPSIVAVKPARIACHLARAHLCSSSYDSVSLRHFRPLQRPASVIETPPRQTGRLNHAARTLHCIESHGLELPSAGGLKAYSRYACRRQ
eukprot:SAG31_NODE_104_length_25069_cov_12.917144_24_plen_241_part_00